MPKSTFKTKTKTTTGVVVSAGLAMSISVVAVVLSWALIGVADFSKLSQQKVFHMAGEGDKAGVYYVSTTGSDSNPGTESLPWRTIQKAADTLSAGETVYIKAGTYSERIIPKNSGTPGNYITYQAYPEDIVVIDGDGVQMGWNHIGMVEINNKSYIKFSGFKIEDSKGDAILVWHSDHIIVERNYIYRSCSRGIIVEYCNNIIVDGNEVELGHSWVGPSWPNGYSGTGEDISIIATDVFEVKNNEVHHGYKEGIDIQASSSNGSVHHNNVHHQGKVISGVGIYVDGGYYLNYGYPGTPTININIYQNIVHDIYGPGLSIGTEMGGGVVGGWIENIIFDNNISYNNVNGMATLEVPGTRKLNIWFINNTSFNNSNSGFMCLDSQFENLILRNNILSGNGAQISNSYNQYLGNFTADHNLINGYTQMYGTDYVTGDPKFVDIASNDFHIQSGSPAIDKGSDQYAPGVDYDGAIRPQGLGFDIGAYEYSSPLLSQPFKRADVNQDNQVGIADAIAILEYLYKNRQISCLDAIDTNDDGEINIADAIKLLGYLFSSGSTPAEPFAACGLDQTVDDLDCESFPSCQ